MIQFPKDFFWGAAISAHQVEGNNIDCDWWEWEKRAGLKETSGSACRHYELYKEDFALAESLHHNALRLSVEWSRIEPVEGKFSPEALEHYKEVILALRERGLEPVVTLHHFTNPIWFSRSGGWENKKSAFYFSRFVEKTVELLCPKVHFWVTINEPLVYTYQSYILGAWPPQEKSFLKARAVSDNLARAHIKAYRAIHNIYQKRNLKKPAVSIAKNMQSFIPCNNALKNKFAAFLRNKFFNFEYIERLIRYRALDYIGVNYYTRSLVEADGWHFKNLMLDVCKNNHWPRKRNSMGWDVYPEGLYGLLKGLRNYRLPVFILENGICTEDDSLRWDFIQEHLKVMHRAMQEGVPFLGYLYWSLLDNYEWDKGFAPRFGLIEVDYNTYQRTIRESARKYALVCKTGRLE